MNTRQEAVAYLTGHGFHAEERDWVLGKSILVAAPAVEAAGIKVHVRAVYIVPNGEGWVGFELHHPRIEDDEIVSLEQACARALRILSAGNGHSERYR